MPWRFSSCLREAAHRFAAFRVCSSPVRATRRRGQFPRRATIRQAAHAVRALDGTIWHRSKFRDGAPRRTTIATSAISALETKPWKVGLPPLQASSHSRSLPGERGKVLDGSFKSLLPSNFGLLPVNPAKIVPRSPMKASPSFSSFPVAAGIASKITWAMWAAPCAGVTRTCETGPAEARDRRPLRQHERSGDLLTHYVFASLFHQDPRYFYQFSPKGYAVGINAMVYTMTH